MSQNPHADIDRRRFLGAAGTFAAASFLGGADAEATAQSTGRRTTAAGSMNAAVRAIDVQGARLPEGVLRMSGVEAPPKG